LEIDILTGKPKIFGQAPRGQRVEQVFAEKHKLVKDIETGQEVERQLAGKDGKFFLKLVETALARRIEHLVSNDAEAKALLDILKALGWSLRIGKASAKRLIAIQMESSTPL
jgi:hypothetical protein